MKDVVYVYRIMARFPDEPNWAHWEEDNPVVDRSEFRWPRRRNFFTAKGALDIAHLMERWGATVEVVRSSPVEFPFADDVDKARSARCEAENDAAIVGLRKLISSLENDL